MNPGPLVGDGDVDEALADEGAEADGQADLPKEAKKRNKHARQRAQDQPEDDHQGEHDVADIQDVCCKAYQVCHNLDMN